MTTTTPLPQPTHADCASAIASLAARRVECALGDFTSIARGKRVSNEDFSTLGGCKMPSVVLGLTLTGGEPQDVIGPLLPAQYIDMHLVPDLATLVPSPGRQGEATVVCEPTGRWWSQRHGREIDASELSPRAALRAVLADLKARGMQALVAPELELFLLERETAADGAVHLRSARAQPGAPARERACEALSLERLGHFDAYFDELFAGCELLGIPVNGHAHESALSQYEVNFRPGEPLAQADAVFRFKRLARDVAARHGFLASFAPKPFLDQPGTGKHWHFSLQRSTGDWPHVFAQPDGRDTATLGHFVAGLQAHAAASMAFFAPYGMSYERIVLSDAAPSHASWGPEDRSLAFRIPSAGPSGRRVENRLPGGDANPYLTVALTLGLGLAGLQAGRSPQDGTSDEHALPTSLSDALTQLDGDRVVRGLLGDPLVDAYIGIKRHEHAEREAQIDPRQHWDMRHLIELA